MTIRDFARGGFARLPPRTRRWVLHRLGRYAPWEAGFDFTPPAPHAGEVTGPPDFVGIGAQKAGTTWWFELLLDHPGMSSHSGVHKERHFFDRFGARPMGPPDVARYHGWFPRREGTITGEWTPDYMAYPWVPALLQRAAPDARLLVLLRDPVERYRSGLDHDARAGYPTDARSIADAVQRGFYHRALADWLAVFDAEQLLVLQYERCVRDTEGQLDRTFRHLGLVTPHRPVPSVSPDRTRAEHRTELADDLRERLVDLYAADVAALAADVPAIDLALWPNFAHLAVGAAPPSADSGGASNSPTTRR